MWEAMKMSLDNKVSGSIVYGANLGLPYILGAGHPFAALGYGASWAVESFHKPFEGGVKLGVDIARGLGALWFAYSAVTDLMTLRPIQALTSAAMTYQLARDIFTK